MGTFISCFRLGDKDNFQNFNLICEAPLPQNLVDCATETSYFFWVNLFINENYMVLDRYSGLVFYLNDLILKLGG